MGRSPYGLRWGKKKKKNLPCHILATCMWGRKEKKKHAPWIVKHMPNGWAQLHNLVSVNQAWIYSC